jgi:hypothetical protein
MGLYSGWRGTEPGGMAVYRLKDIQEYLEAREK